MVTIYVLVDPRNNLPFYVGATQGLLKDRLGLHITYAKQNEHHRGEIFYRLKCLVYSRVIIISNAIRR